MDDRASKDHVGRPPLDLRRATAADADAMTRIATRSKAVWGYDAAFMARCRDELTWDAGRLRDVAAVVAVSNGEPLGFYVLGEGEAGAVELDAMFVCPERMRRGVGRALMHDAVRRARATGAPVLTIASDPHAEGFYLAMGARRVGLVPSQSIPGRALPRLVLEL